VTQRASLRKRADRRKRPAIELAMSTPASRLPKMMIGFVVRRCIVELGHTPSAAEFAAWANGGDARLFGRAISVDEAALILRHRARLVTAKSAAPDEQYVEIDEFAAAPNVVRLADVRARRAAR
jgi:hypothetical protein